MRCNAICMEEILAKLGFGFLQQFARQNGYGGLRFSLS